MTPEQRKEAVKLLTDTHFVALTTIKTVQGIEGDDLAKFVGVLSAVGQLGINMVKKVTDEKGKQYIGAQLAQRVLTVSDVLMKVGSGEDPLAADLLAQVPPDEVKSGD